MQGRSGKRRLLGAALALMLSGALVFAIASSAAASGPYNWTPFNLSSEAGGTQADGGVGLIADPQSSSQDAATDSPSQDILVWSGDGSAGTSVQNVTSLAGGPLSNGTPSVVKDPQSGDLLVFAVANDGSLESYDRMAAPSTWKYYSITQLANNGPTIASQPSATVVASTNLLAVAAAASNGDLIVYNRTSTGGWSATDVTSATGQSIVGNPVALSDPGNSELSVMADTSSGHFVEFADGDNGWGVTDITSDFGGQTISSDLFALSQGGTSLAFAEAPGGDLIMWQRPPGSGAAWTSENLTTLANGPTITDAPVAVADPDGGIAVVAQGANQHLIEYTGSGSNWSATDLTAGGGPTVAGGASVTVSSQTGDLDVYGSSPANNLVEDQRTPAPTTTTTSTVVTTQTVTTQTVESTPAPPRTTTTRKSVRVKVELAWTWNRTTSELHALTLGELAASEGLTLTCRGPGRKTNFTGCPYKRRTAKGRKAVVALVKRTAKTRYRVGDVLSMTISETGRRSEVAHFTIRANRAPKVTR